MLQQETFLFTLICLVVFVRDAKGRESTKLEVFQINCMFYLHCLNKAFAQLKEKKLIIKTGLAVENNLSSYNSKLNVKERQFKI